MFPSPVRFSAPIRQVVQASLQQQRSPRHSLPLLSVNNGSDTSLSAGNPIGDINAAINRVFKFTLQDESATRVAQPVTTSCVQLPDASPRHAGAEIVFSDAGANTVDLLIRHVTAGKEKVLVVNPADSRHRGGGLDVSNFRHTNIPAEEYLCLVAKGAKRSLDLASSGYPIGVSARGENQVYSSDLTLRHSAPLLDALVTSPGEGRARLDAQRDLMLEHGTTRLSSTKGPTFDMVSIAAPDRRKMATMDYQDVCKGLVRQYAHMLVAAQNNNVGTVIIPSAGGGLFAQDRHGATDTRYLQAQADALKEAITRFGGGLKIILPHGGRQLQPLLEATLAPPSAHGTPRPVAPARSGNALVSASNAPPARRSPVTSQQGGATPVSTSRHQPSSNTGTNRASSATPHGSSRAAPAVDAQGAPTRPLQQHRVEHRTECGIGFTMASEKTAVPRALRTVFGDDRGVTLREILRFDRDDVQGTHLAAGQPFALVARDPNDPGKALLSVRMDDGSVKTFYANFDARLHPYLAALEPRDMRKVHYWREPTPTQPVTASQPASSSQPTPLQHALGHLMPTMRSGETDWSNVSFHKVHGYPIPDEGNQPYWFVRRHPHKDQALVSIQDACGRRQVYEMTYKASALRSLDGKVRNAPLF